MDDVNLLATFYGQRVDQSELEQLLLGHFSRSRAVALDQVEYQRSDGDAPALVLRYDRDGRLQAIAAGSTLTEVDVALLRKKVEDALIAGDTPTIGRLILFASVPTVHYFKYKDVF